MKSSWKKLKQEFEDKGIVTCEVRLEDCRGNWWLTPAHRLKRRFYTPETLWTFPEVVLACIGCHMKMEQDKELTKQVFERLRPLDKLPPTLL